MKKYWSTVKGSSRQTSRRRQLGWLGVCAVLAIGAFYVVPKLLLVLATLFLAPFISVQQWVFESSDAFPRYVQDRAALVAEIQTLQQALAEQQVTVGVIRSLQADNIALRQLLHATTTDRIAAQVTTRPDSLPYDVLLIDRGSESGLVVGAPVYYGLAHVIGTVAHVFPHSALVTLITSPNVASTVYVLGPNIYTTAVGQGGGVLRVSVPQGVPLASGDPLLLPSIAGGVLGEVFHVESIPSEPNQFGYVRLPEAIQSLRFVSVGATPVVDLSFEEAQANVAKTRTDLFTVAVPAGVLIEETATSTDARATSTSTPTP